MDNVGRDMFHGGGRMVIAAGDRKTGAGHFGRTVVEEGVELMSFHWEADFDQGGRSVLGIRPLIWRNGWPLAGERVKQGTYEIESERRGYSLELAVDFVRMKQERRRWFDHEQMKEPAKPIPNQTLEEVQANWPEGDVAVRCSDYMFRPWQRWTVKPVPDAGGNLCGPLYEIKIEGTNRALTATADLRVVASDFRGQDAQLWFIEQLTDGTYRIMPSAIPGRQGRNSRYCLYSAGDSTPALAEFDFASDNSKWNFRNH
jgi:arabinan endo-1,5-alpha-L-arabinosidase